LIENLTNQVEKCFFFVFNFDIVILCTTGFSLWCSAWFLCQFLDYFHDGHVNIVYDDILKACFSKHSQWPPKSFRLRQAWELVLFLSFLGCLRQCLLDYLMFILHWFVLFLLI